MKKILIFLIILAVVPISLASSPKFTTNILLEEDMKNGADIDFGDILFIESPYESETTPMSTIMNNTFQQYDIMKWKGNNSIKITNTGTGLEMILTYDSEYYFTSVANHIIQSMVNASISNFIYVTPKDPNIVNITDIDVPTGFDLRFSETNFTLCPPINLFKYCLDSAPKYSFLILNIFLDSGASIPIKRTRSFSPTIIVSPSTTLFKVCQSHLSGKFLKEKSNTSPLIRGD